MLKVSPLGPSGCRKLAANVKLLERAARHPLFGVDSFDLGETAMSFVKVRDRNEFDLPPIVFVQFEHVLAELAGALCDARDRVTDGR